jgi:2-oxoglutarate/2-oxoacid ferredoxin oxidoreductase subunit alpha
VGVLKRKGTDAKTADKSKNMFALGIMYHLFGWSLEATYEFFNKKFKINQRLAECK